MGDILYAIASKLSACYPGPHRLCRHHHRCRRRRCSCRRRALVVCVYVCERGAPSVYKSHLFVRNLRQTIHVTVCFVIRRNEKEFAKVE